MYKLAAHKMGQYKFVFVLTVLFVIQVSAKSKLGNSFVQELITSLKSVKESVQSQADKIEETVTSNLEISGATLDGFAEKHINDAITSLDRRNCATNTELALQGLKLSVSVNFLACINITKSIADFQQLSYDLFLFGEKIENVTLQVLSSVKACYGYTFFKAATCVITTIQNYTANYTTTSAEIITFINRTEALTDDLVLEFKECLFGSQSYANNAISTVLKQNCKS